jgi:WD40 repeat protein
MQDASLAGATLRDTVFSEALDATWKVTISNSGQYWAAGSRRGEVRVWREAGQTLYLLWQAHTDTVSALAFDPDERRLASGSWRAVPRSGPCGKPTASKVWLSPQMGACWPAAAGMT